MAYGTDVTVFVEDNKGDQGGPPDPPGKAWWLSPDIDIPAHSGEAVQGPNDVEIRVHAADEPFIFQKIAAEVYVASPGFVLSPANGTKRIDPGNLLWRPANVAGTEPVANIAGSTLTFTWTPSASPTDLDGPGHHCLILRAFPLDVTPPTDPFDVPNERHEAQHNLEILMTTTAQADMVNGGAGTRKNPRRRETATGMWWERFATMAVAKSGKRFAVWAFDPSPSKQLAASVRAALGKAKFSGFSKEPPRKVALEAVDAKGEEIDPGRLLQDSRFAERSGVGQQLFAPDRLLGAAAVELSPSTPSGLILRFDHSNLKDRTAVVLHGAQWSEYGDPEGGMTVVALAPTGP